MHDKAYESQVAAVENRCSDPRELAKCRLTLLSLAFGSFCIGTSEFASMGILQLFADSLNISIPKASSAVTAYAFGVVVGAPLVTLVAARLNRRVLLLMLMALFIFGNIISAFASSLNIFVVARFISGMPQGAYFGAGAVVASYMVGAGHGGKAFALVMTGLTVATIVGSPLATFLGQNLGWRETYLAVCALSVLAMIALWMYVPRTPDLDGSSVSSELTALRKPMVWVTMLVASIGVASIFAVYTFIGPMITDVAAIDRAWIPVALAVFGVGMTAGNFLGGRIADAQPARGVFVGFGSAVFMLAVLASFGSNVSIMFIGFFAVGATMMTAIPTIQVRLTRLAPEAPTLMGAMNLASLNVANAVGAWCGGLVVAQGYGLLSAVWVGCGLTLVGLIVFTTTLSKRNRLIPA